MVILLVFGTGDGGSTPLGTIIFTVGNPMENILVAGVNTRSVACSLKKLGCTVYSADYFGTLDLQQCVSQYNSILSQEPYFSCGKFTEKFKSGDIEELTADFIQEADFIICLAGVSPENLPKNKVMGNKSVEKINDKYVLSRRLGGKFNFPLTFSVSDIGEAGEITGNYPDKNFIIKPIQGSGGYGIRQLDKMEEDLDLSGYILQEELDGLNISASVLSTGNESRTILTSQQIIGNTQLGQMEPYGYCGNVTPLTDENITHEVSESAEEIIDYLQLIGSNGVDFILNDDGLHVIEVNPRIQGTMECAELSLNINMAEAHMEACQGNLMDVPQPKRYTVKMVVFAKWRSIAGNLNLEGVYDIPAQNVIIEKDEPAATVVTGGETLEKAVKNAQIIVDKVYDALVSYPERTLAGNV